MTFRFELIVTAPNVLDYLDLQPYEYHNKHILSVHRLYSLWIFTVTKQSSQYRNVRGIKNMTSRTTTYFATPYNRWPHNREPQNQLLNNRRPHNGGPQNTQPHNRWPLDSWQHSREHDEWPHNSYQHDQRMNHSHQCPRTTYQHVHMACVAYSTITADSTCTGQRRASNFIDFANLAKKNIHFFWQKVKYIVNCWHCVGPIYLIFFI
jgi:hypothetical protein